MREPGSAVPIGAAGLLVAALTAGLACSKDPAPLGTPRPARTGLPDFSDVRARIQELVAHGIPSIAVAVAADGKILWEEAFGWEDREALRAATIHTRYPVGSISKPFAATAVMILEERGAIDLAAPANRYLGPARLRRHDGDSADVTVRDLLQHRGGLPAPHVSRYYDGDSRPPPPAVEATIRRYGLVIDPPGRRFAYSNLGYGILAHMVSRVAGVSYAEFLARELCAPLGLGDTTLELGTTPPRAATLYRDGKPLPGYRFDEEGSGRIWSSVHDLARFALFHLGEPLADQRPVLSRRARLAMASDTRPSGQRGGVWGPDWFYGLGWSGREESEYNAYRWYGHDGGLPGTVAELRIVPGRRLAIAIVSNDDSAPTKAILELVLEAMMPGNAWARREDPAARSRPPRRRFIAPAALVGTWRGEIRTWSESVPVRLDIGRTGARVLLGDSAAVALDGLDIFQGRLRGRSTGRLPQPDLGDLPYELWYELRRDGDQLVGAVYAADTHPLRHFVLPSWMRLKRQVPLDWGPRPEGPPE
jgi:CubicO group peptidase (beta-lactamase class C family)